MAKLAMKAKRPTAASTSAAPGRGDVNIVAIIRNGTFRVGTPFIADMGWGVITRIANTWGDTICNANTAAGAASASPGKTSSVAVGPSSSSSSSAAPTIEPGTAVVLYGSHDTSCPAGGVHVISMNSADEAERVSKFRNRLRHFIERHPKHTKLLRPEGANCDFLHVGNYGQVSADAAYDYNLLYKEAKSPEVRESPLELRWRANQLSPDEQPRTEADQEKLLRSMRVLQVHVKVDNYSSARVASREIPRLSTKDVFLNVASIGFGPFVDTEMQSLGKIDVAIAFRAPRLSCAKTHFFLDAHKIQYGEFDVYTDMIEWTKALVLAAQAEESAKRNPEDATNKELQIEMLRAAGFADTTKAKRTRQQMTPTRGLQPAPAPSS